MNEKQKEIYRRATYLQIGVCGVLFTLFSFIYIYIFQGDVMEALHYAMSQGHTHYIPLVGAVVTTVVMLIFRWAINKLMGLKGPVRALAYFPPCLLLGVMTDIHRSAFHGESFAGYWQWLLPLFLGLFVAVGCTLRWAFRGWFDREMQPTTLWNANLLILLACCSMTVAIGNTDVFFHRELQVERMMREHDYDRALQVGKESKQTTHTLSALRAYALSLDGSMGEKLFEYPQYYGAAGLMFPKDTCRTLRVNNDSLMHYLGNERRRNETTVAYLERQFHAGDGRYTVFDYYLCALLLDKQLDRFMRVAECNLDPESLPRHYREALALYSRLHPAYKGWQADASTVARLEEFLAKQREYADPVEEKNRMRREFGDTYWWYFRYQ